MKPKLIAILTAAASFLLTGCWQKSVNPFYADKDVYTEPQLLGTWNNPKKEGDDAESWTFARNDAFDTVYNVRIKDGKTSLELDVRAFKLGGQRFLDFHSRNRSANEIPAHHLVRIDRLDTALQLQILSLEGIHDYLASSPNALAHVRESDPEHPNDRDKDEFVLTAPTDQLQKFILAHAKDDKFFESFDELKKVESR